MQTLKPTYRYLIWLSVPSILSSLLNNLYRLIDQYFVQWLSEAAQAALGASTFLLFSGYSIFMLISAGTAPFIARYTGANDEKNVADVISQGLRLATYAGMIFSLFLAIGAPWLTLSVGLQGEAATELESYLFWLGISGTGMAFGPMLDTIWISRGNTQTPMKLQILSTLLNIVLNALFIFQLGCGIAGAAIASGISRWIAVGVGFYLLQKECQLLWKPFFPAQKILSMGFPVASGSILYSVVYWSIMYLCISPLGDAVHVALGLGFSVLEGISYPTYAGVMMASSSMIGRQIGAQQFSDLTATIRKGTVLSTILGGVAMMVFLFGADAICAQFTQSTDAQQQAVLYAHVLAFSQICVAWEAMAEGILGGAGDNKRLFWLSAPVNILRIPLAYYFCFALGMQAMGIWWAINITTYIKCALKWNAVRVGRWRTLEI